MRWTAAAPGGKTAYMAESMHDTGRIFAWDKHEHRELLALVQRMRYYNVFRCAMLMTHWEQFDSDMDVVLLDAPCSGMGCGLNKPEIRYGLTPEGLADLCNIQQRCWTWCAAMRRPSGSKLVYATCSILPEENTQQGSLCKAPDFTIEKLPDTIPRSALRAHETPLGLQLFPTGTGWRASTWPGCAANE